MVPFFLLFPFLFSTIVADLWTETARMPDLQKFRELCGRSTVARAYLEDTNARITVFAPIDDVFIHNPDMRVIDVGWTLSHIADTQIIEIGQMKKWEKRSVVWSNDDSGHIVNMYESNQTFVPSSVA